VYLFAGPVFNDYSTVGYSTLIKKEKMIEVLVDRVRYEETTNHTNNLTHTNNNIRLPGAEFGCVYMAEFLTALAGAVKKNENSLKAFTRLIKMEPPMNCTPAHDTGEASDEPLQTGRITRRIQELLHSETTKYSVITETGKVFPLYSTSFSQPLSLFSLFSLFSLLCVCVCVCVYMCVCVCVFLFRDSAQQGTPGFMDRN